MRLYHSQPNPSANIKGSSPKPDGSTTARHIFNYPNSFPFWLICCLFAFTIIVGCTAPQATQALISIKVNADGRSNTFKLPAGSTAQQALNAAGIELDDLDRVEPAIYTSLTEGAIVRVIRVTEEFELEEVTIPFNTQTLRNESLPQDKEILIQKGQNGLEEITYRRIYEDGVDVSGKPIPVKTITLVEPIPEIRMIGIQAPFTPVAIPGTLLYLRDGNAWLIEATTANRQAIVTSGDLDGRVFSLSPDGEWLLFTRSATSEEQINSLWAVNIDGESQNDQAADEEAGESYLVDLEIDNIVHFADWIPGPDIKIAFSTVEPRTTAPGWQANNDLNTITFSDNTWISNWTVVLESNSGGVYGWWGTNFIWGPDSEHLTYTRPDGVGTLNYKNGETARLFDLVPFQTRGDWAWVSGIAWSPDGQVLYATEHNISQGAISPEESQHFDLIAVPNNGNPALKLATETGMFAYPIVSPIQSVSGATSDYQIAYLQAIFPEQSESSQYRVIVMDRDGSNRNHLFPEEEYNGINPQINWGAWSPEPLPEIDVYAIAILHQGNLWIVDSQTGEANQITGDGLTTRIIWQ
jgi:hypothetical protein